jgi:hypothetical protein
MRSLLTRLLALMISVMTLWLALNAPAFASPTTANELSAARARWAAQGISSYRIALDVEVRGKRCFQSLTVRDGLVRQMVDTCEEPWLGILTVPRIFAISERVANLPHSRCFPASQACTCHRVFIQRQFDFDATYGVPDLTRSHSENTVNWQHPDFWTHMLVERTLPSCTGVGRTLVVRLVSFTPAE